MTFFISLESYWNIDVENGLPLFIWTSETQVMAKRRVEVKLVVWFPTTKSREPTRFTYLHTVCNYYWKALDESYNFASDLISIEGLLAKLWGSKVTGIPTWAISGLSLGSPKTKSHLDVSSVASHRIYYKGEGGDFPQVRALVSLVCPCCPWLVLTPKVLQLCTNHIVLVLCRPVWVNEACQLFLVPCRSSNTPLYPLKCCELGSVLRVLPLPLFFYLDSHLNPSRNWECVRWTPGQ
jgi:hypothetical protein